MSVKTFTTAEKILMALYEEQPCKGHVFTEADITVIAWKRFPETFGLRGYADQYPDSKHILSNIMGQKGLRAKRWISPLGDTRYTLTQSGLDYAGDLNRRTTEVREQVKMSVSNEYIRVLKRLFEGAAYQFWHEQHPEELIFRDACNFWNITPASTNEELEDRLTTIENVFSFMRRLLKEEGNLKISNRMSISKRDVDSCSNLNRHLQATFADDLSYIKRRENRHGIKRMSHDIR